MNSKPTDTWPFDQPRNCVCLTMRQILDGSEPILFVSHDADDHGWQFIGSSDASVSDSRVVSLETIVKHDPTVLELADLPPGWRAIRSKVGSSWRRELRPPDADDEQTDHTAKSPKPTAEGAVSSTSPTKGFIRRWLGFYGRP
jgi:hypothetical protein